MKYNFNKSYWQNMRDLKKGRKATVSVTIIKDAEYHEAVAKLKKQGINV